MGITFPTGAGIELHAGKTRIGNGRDPTSDIDDLGEEVWSPEGLQSEQRRSSNLSQTVHSRKNEESGTRSRQCPISDAHGSCCCGARAHDVTTLLRTVPPSQPARYAAGHDEGMFQTMMALLGALPGNQEQIATARGNTTLPMRPGGLGLRSAARTGPGAFGASWAQALPMLHDRLPTATEETLAQLFVGKPSREELKARGKTPPLPSSHRRS